MAPKYSRRTFAFKGLQLTSTFAIANSALYAVGSAFKNLDGSLTAGAKVCYHHSITVLTPVCAGCGSCNSSHFGDVYNTSPLSTCSGNCDRWSGGCIDTVTIAPPANCP